MQQKTISCHFWFSDTFSSHFFSTLFQSEFFARKLNWSITTKEAEFYYTNVYLYSLPPIDLWNFEELISYLRILLFSLKPLVCVKHSLENRRDFQALTSFWKNWSEEGKRFVGGRWSSSKVPCCYNISISIRIRTYKNIPADQGSSLKCWSIKNIQISCTIQRGNCGIYMKMEYYCN